MKKTSNYKYQYIIRPNDNINIIARRFNITIKDIASVNPQIDINNMRTGQTIYIPQKVGDKSEKYVNKCKSKAEMALNNEMRLLWEQHVYWTRMLIISMAFNLPDAQLVANRLLQNPEDFKTALTPFYGEANAAVFADLLTAHLVIASELVKAAIVGNTAAAADAEARWYKNADQIAAFLASINPYWSYEQWQKMLCDHLAMTKAEAVDILNKDYTASISEFENIEKQAMVMADIMTQGIVKQFPQYFK